MRNHLNSFAARFVGVLAVVFACGAARADGALPSTAYARDGLVAQWDGINNVGTGTHDASATVWRDLVAGREFALTKVTIGARGLVFNGSDSYGKLATDALLAFPAGIKTVEIFIRSDKTDSRLALMGPTGSGVAFGYSPYRTIPTSGSKNGYCYPLATVGATNGYTTVYADDGTAATLNLNGAAVSSSDLNYWGSPDANAWIGRRSGGNYFKGEIYAIRVYSRELTATEIAENNAVDRQRFADDASGPLPTGYELAADTPAAQSVPAGTRATPTLNVFNRFTGAVLVKDTDYTVTFADNNRPGTATAIVAGLGAYASSTATVSFAVSVTYRDDLPVPVEYFQANKVTDGKQWLDTGLPGNAIYRLFLGICHPILAASWQFAFYTDGNTSVNTYGGNTGMMQGKIRNTSISYQYWSKTACNHLAFTNGVLTTDGVLSKAIPSLPPFGADANPLLLFTNPAHTYDCCGQCYYLRAFGYNDEVLLNGIAVVSNGIAGLYDLSSGRLRANGGLGDFTYGVPAASFVVDPIGPQTAVAGAEVAPVPVVRSASTGELLVENTHYTVTRVPAGRTSAGSVTVTALGDHFGAVTLYYNVRCVRFAKITGGSPTASGADWAHAMDLQTAIDASYDQDIVYVQAGSFDVSSDADGYVVTNAVRIIGGCAGTDGTSTALAANPVTRLDGGNAANQLFKFTVPYYAARLENFYLTHGYRYGLYKNGTGNLELANVQVVANAATYYGAQTYGYEICGRGAYCESGNLMTTNCLFAGNVCPADQGSCSGMGAGLYVSGLTLDLIDTTFVSNGVPPSVVANRGTWMSGAALYSYYATVRARRCVFRGNCICANSGATVTHKQSYDSSYENCLFVGNENVHSASTSGSGSGVINSSGYHMTTTITLKNCTFAYNLSNSSGAGAVNSESGKYYIRNCLFYGNLVPKNSTYGADIAMRDATYSAADVDYSFFAANTLEYASGDKLTMGEHNVYGGDPKLVSALADACALLETDTSTTSPRRDAPIRYRADAVASVHALDVHLLSPEGYVELSAPTVWKQSDGILSPAIDKADPDDAYSAEPAPNGSRRNMGAYGNTPEASKTPQPGQPVIPADGVQILFANEYTQPTVEVTMSATKPKAVYEAHVTIYVGTGAAAAAGTTYQFTNEYTGVQNGDVLSWRLSHFFEPNERLYVKVVVDGVAGATTVTEITNAPAEGTKPYWAGHGGGANVLHVFQEATGCGDGSSWTDAFTDLYDAISHLLPQHTEIWVTTNYVPNALVDDTTQTIYVPVTIRGGFTAAEDTAAARPEGSVTTVEGGGVRKGCKLTLEATPVTLERIHFQHAADRGLYCKMNYNALTLDRCTFVSNGYTTVTSSHDGLGLYVAGANTFSTIGGTLTMTDCDIAYNVFTNSTSGNGGNGQGARFTDIARVTMDRCTFRENGVSVEDITQTSNRGQAYSALSARTAPITARNCRFIANRARNSGAIALTGGGGTSGFTNCLFAVNENCGSGNAGSSGTVYLELETTGNKAAGYTNSISFANCTFAYNLDSGSASGAAAMGVMKGLVTLRNSIFYGNVVRTANPGSSDLRLYSGEAFADVDYCCFRENTSAYLSGDGLTKGDNNLFADDPLFVTGTDDFLDLVVSADDSTKMVSRAATPFAFDRTQADVVSAVDLHLLSKTGYVNNAGVWQKTSDGTHSRAIDAGDPASAYDLEPAPNGSRINLGMYGNTPEASMTPPAGQPAIAEGALTVSFPNSYTQPEIAVTLSGTEPGATYSATVTLYCGEDYSKTFYNVQNGDVLTWRVSGFFESGESVSVRAVAEVGGGTSVAQRETSVSAQGVKPPWAGHGGGAGVLHVFPGATGCGDGSSWTDAFTDFRAAMQNLSATRLEVWVTTNVQLSAEQDGMTFTVASPITVRGGFTGVEDQLSQRPNGTVSVYDGEGARTGLSISLGANVAFERMTFTRAYDLGFSAAVREHTLRLTDCAFVANGYPSTTTAKALGARIDGSNSFATYMGYLYLTRCTFLDNVTSNTTSAVSRGFNGCGAYITRFIRVTLDDCHFEGNGVSAENAPGSGWANPSWAALCVQYAPVTMRGCSFIANRVRSGSGICSIEGYGQDTAISNCLFAANDMRGNSGANALRIARTTTESGNIGKNRKVDVVNCTFGYNVSETTSGPAALRAETCDLRVRNSIFSGNVNASGAKTGRDIHLLNDTTADVDYTLFKDATTNCISAVEGGTLTIGTHNVYDDAYFMTKYRTFRTWLSGSASLDLARDADFRKVNCHLTGRQGYIDAHTGALVIGRGHESPAIDAGDPSVPCVEPDKRYGNRVNLGAYGNTPYATLSPVAGTFLRVR